MQDLDATDPTCGLKNVVIPIAAGASTKLNKSCASRNHRGTVTRINHCAPLLLVMILGLAWPVYGHAILLKSTPSANQEVSGKNIPIELHFNSRVDGKRSRLTLIYPDGKQSPLVIEQASPGLLSSRTADVAPGRYALRWQVIAEDGHISRGEVLFQAK